MDEVRMVRDSYPEPAPPTAREIAEAKALLNDPPRRSPLSRFNWGVSGLVAAGAAAAVAVTLVGVNTLVGGEDGSVPVPPGAVNLDGKGAVLAAAAKAESQPTGNYWHADVVGGQAYVVRPKTGTYAITAALYESFHWTGVRSGMGEGYYGRDLPARPQTERDKALWRKAGSPSTFRVWSGDGFNNYSTKVTPWKFDGPERGTDSKGGGKFIVDYTVEDLQNLPTDPAKLAEKFLNSPSLRRGDPSRAGAGGNPEEKAKRAKAGDVSATPASKISRVSSILDAPIPPKVRAGLMRALANQPGISAIGRVTDPLGRKGIALAASEQAFTDNGEFGTPKAQQGTYRARQVIVFDERTGVLLSRQYQLTKPGGTYVDMKPGFIIEYQVVRSAQWTDSRPKPQAELPFD